MSLRRLTELARAATPGPWWTTEDLDCCADDPPAVGVAAGPCPDYTSMVVTTPGMASFDAGEPTDHAADAFFVAAANPVVVLELLARLAAAELLLAELAHLDASPSSPLHFGHGVRRAVDGMIRDLGAPLSTVSIEGVCRECGCTDDAACDGGCWWVEPDLCSACARYSPAVEGVAAPAGVAEQVP